MPSMDTKTYDDFEPFCKWQKESTYDILKVYLQGFKKEEIKIEMNSKDEIVICGERLLDGSPNQMKRFRKEIRVSPKEYNIQEIEANFEADCLSIIMPRKVGANTKLADQLLRLNLYPRPEIGKTSSTTVKALVAVSLGITLGVFSAYTYTHFSSVPSSN